MAEGFTSYNVDADRAFRDTLASARERVSDLRIPLAQIQRDFHKTQKAVFMLKGRGQYPDLAESTKRAKIKKYGSAYPILKATGRLERSVTNPTDPEAISEIVNKDTLFIGTRVPYAGFHQSDDPRSRVPLRKFLFIGPEAVQFASDPKFTGRLQRWQDYLSNYVIGQMERELRKKSAA